MYRRTVILGIICCLLISMAGIAVADSESLRATNAIDTPEETFQGHTVTHIGVFEQEDQIEATITGEGTYDIGLFDSSNAEIANKTEVDGTFSFNPNNLALEPGSYYLSVTNTFFEKISPIVISGYDIAVDLTEDTAANELSIDATVTETALQGEPHKVEAVVWNDDRETRTELTADGEFSSSGEYESTIEIDDFDGEPYNVYVVAVSENEIQGENEILAIGEASGGEEDDSDDSNGTDNGSDDTGDDSDGSHETDNSSDDESDDFEDGDDTGESTDEQNESDPDAGDDDVDDVDDDPSVIEPNTSAGGDDTTGTDDSTQAEDDSIDDLDDETPLSIVLPVVALLLASVGIMRL